MADMIPRFRIKSGVKLCGAKGELLAGFLPIYTTFAAYGFDTTLTCCVDGTHGYKSAHYSGRAADFRSRHIPEAQREEIKRELSEALGDEFDVVLEPDHYHIEYDPK